MAFGNGASTSVRPTAETPSETEEVFARALDEALAPFGIMMSSRQRTAAIARARREILAAADAMMKAEKRRIVEAERQGDVAELWKEVDELIAAHKAVLNYVDDLERQPVIAGEVRRLRRTGQIPWFLVG
jgi:hypothetical protein